MNTLNDLARMGEEERGREKIIQQPLVSLNSIVGLLIKKVIVGTEMQRESLCLNRGNHPCALAVHRHAGFVP